MKREQNVGPVERSLRIAGGGFAAFIGLAFLLAGPASLLWGVAYIALALLGLDFVVTGITGYCPLYNRLGLNTAVRNGNGGNGGNGGMSGMSGLNDSKSTDAAKPNDKATNSSNSDKRGCC